MATFDQRIFGAAAADNLYLPVVIHQAQPAATPSPTATGAAPANLLVGNMPLPTGWRTNGPNTSWEGDLRVQDEPVIEMTLYDCGDTSGNNRLDTLENIIQTGQIGLLFLVPGVDETLRVNGTAVLSTPTTTSPFARPHLAAILPCSSPDPRLPPDPP